MNTRTPGPWIVSNVPTIDQANARLIAAAPELLTALTGLLATAEVVDAGNKRHGEDRYGFAQSLFEQCRAVITKATT